MSAQLCLYCVIHCGDLWIESHNNSYNNDSTNDNDDYCHEETATSTNCIALNSEEHRIYLRNEHMHTRTCLHTHTHTVIHIEHIRREIKYETVNINNYRDIATFFFFAHTLSIVIVDVAILFSSFGVLLVYVSLLLNALLYKHCAMCVMCVSTHLIRQLN